MKYKIKYQENDKVKTKIVDVDSQNSIYELEEMPKNIIDIKRADIFKKDFLFFKNSKKEIYELFKQLSIMLNSNLTLNQAVELLIKTNKNQVLKDILNSIELSIKTAQPIDIALEKYKKILGTTVILFLKLGIENGNIKESIASLVEILKEDIESSSKFKEVLRYPLILVISLMISIALIFIYVVPSFEFVFSYLKDDMPLSTTVLLFVKDIFENYLFLIIGFVLATPFVVIKVYNKFRFTFDKILIRNLKIISRVVQDYYYYRLFLSISIIVKSKYQFQLAIANSKDIVKNQYVQMAMKNILINIKNGSSIANAFEQSDIFDELTIKLLYTAEHTNQYELILHDIATYYKNRFNDSLKKFASFIEPVIVLVISLLVLWLILAVMVPIWQLGSVV